MFILLSINHQNQIRYKFSQLRQQNKEMCYICIKSRIIMKLNRIKYTLFALLMLFSIGLMAETSAQNMPFAKGENLKFNLYYQWGLIWKKAAIATLTTQETIYQSNTALKLRMAARTTSFFDNFVKVRDTLVSLTTPRLQPLFYTKITHEGSYHGKDELFYTYTNGKVSTRARTFRDGIQRDDTTFLHNGNPVFDMMSIFYYIRTLDIASMKKNQTIPIVIVSGNRPFNIKVTYQGVVDMKTPQDQVYPTYKLTIVFEHLKKNKIEREVMEFWMSRDDRRLPMQLAAKLPIGSLKAFFQGIE